MIDLLLEEKEELLSLARASLSRYLCDGTKPYYRPKNSGVQTKCGAFVTLRKDDRLRGCIGHILPTEPVYQIVIDCAIAAAVKDPRFSSVTRNELDDIRIEISLLSTLWSVSTIDDIKVGVHGLVISKGPRQGLLLPQVAIQQGWDHITFLEYTCLKAGLPKEAWKKGAKVRVFSVQVFKEGEITP